HHHFADGLGGDFGFAQRLDLPLDARDELVDPFLRDAALAAGQRDRLLDLAAIERLARVVVLDHGDFAELDALEGGEPRAAALALAAAADRGVVLGRARVLYLAVLMGAEGAAQTLHPLIDREAGAKLLDAGAHARLDLGIAFLTVLAQAFDHLGDQLADQAELLGAEAARGARRRAEADARGD